MSLRISISQGNHAFGGAADATVVIDVLRAATTAHYLFQMDIDSCRLVGNKAQALSLKNEQTLLVGESGGIKIEGFDYGNSPSQLLANKLNIAGHKIIFLTSNGTKALLNNFNPKLTLFCGFVNAAATVAFLKDQGMSHVHFIASHPSSDDDLACADYMASLLQGNPIAPEQVISRINHSESAEKFLMQPNLFPTADLELARTEDQDHHYVLLAQKDNAWVTLQTSA